MVSLAALWIPILLSALIVFAASSLMHMVLKYHQGDYKKLPDEEKLLGALRGTSLTPGIYMFPYCDHTNMKSPEMQEKFKQGPVGMVTVRQSGAMNMGGFLGMWFGYTLLVGIFVGYLTGHTVAAWAHYLQVFRVAGTAAFMAYGMGTIINSIWKGQPWGMTVKEIIDGLIYACLTAGTFGWLWPKG
jgi:hypothetical protein